MTIADLLVILFVHSSHLMRQGGDDHRPVKKLLSRTSVIIL